MSSESSKGTVAPFVPPSVCQSVIAVPFKLDGLYGDESKTTGPRHN